MIRDIKGVREWTADVAKKLHPDSQTLKAVDWYFATADCDDVNVEWSRSFDGYSNDHFTPETLAEFYKAAKVEISGNYTITIYDN